MLSSDLEGRVGDTFHSGWWAVMIGGTPVDLSSGWIVRAQVRDRAESPVILFELGIQLGTASIPISGETVTVSTARVHIPASNSETVGSFTAVWDLEIYHPTFDNGSLYRKTLVGGVARFTKDVTRT